MKVIKNIDLLKRLQPILEDREAEYHILENGENLETVEIKKLPVRGYKKADNMLGYIPELEVQNFYKTLTLEEAIKFICGFSGKDRVYFNDRISRFSWYLLSVLEIVDLDFIEEQLEYLLDKMEKGQKNG